MLRATRTRGEFTVHQQGLLDFDSVTITIQRKTTGQKHCPVQRNQNYEQQEVSKCCQLHRKCIRILS